MNFWIFKVSDSGPYPDVPGELYVYDNTHSVRVRHGDEFLYLEKGSARYAFTGAGRVAKLTPRRPKSHERHSRRVEQVFTAHLQDVVWFSRPLDISSQTLSGRRNRLLLGLPADVNSIGWSISMPRVPRDLYIRLLDEALKSERATSAEAATGEKGNGWRIDDRWSLARVRRRLSLFRRAVLERHLYTCLMCGTRLRAALEVAHIRRYAADPDNRGNPANGICLCKFCHSAFDAGEVVLLPNGSVHTIGEAQDDEVAQFHFSSVSPSTRRRRLAGVDPRFLLERAEALGTLDGSYSRSVV